MTLTTEFMKKAGYEEESGLQLSSKTATGGAESSTSGNTTRTIASMHTEQIKRARLRRIRASFSSSSKLNTRTSTVLDRERSAHGLQFLANIGVFRDIQNLAGKKNKPFKLCTQGLV